MTDQQTGFSYMVDLVLCIDGTGSMTPVIDAVKRNATQVHSDLSRAMQEKRKQVNQLRIKVIVFRDLGYDGPDAMSSSEFFVMPDQQDAFAAFVTGITASGGGPEPESGLEALAHAINSSWTTDGAKQRHVIAVYTDASTHDLGLGETPVQSNGVPASFDELTDRWEGQEGPMMSEAKRLILFAPDAQRWSDISAYWTQVVHYPSAAGQGMAETDYNAIIDAIANSI